jgi:hypothetical protein
MAAPRASRAFEMEEPTAGPTVVLTVVLTMVVPTVAQIAVPAGKR